jgi:hypothetical protein
LRHLNVYTSVMSAVKNDADAAASKAKSAADSAASAAKTAGGEVVTHAKGAGSNLVNIVKGQTSGLFDSPKSFFEGVGRFFEYGGALGDISEAIACTFVSCKKPAPPPPPPTINISASLLEACTPSQSLNQYNTCSVVETQCSGVNVACTNTAQQSLTCDFPKLSDTLAALVAEENEAARQQLAVLLGATGADSETIQAVVNQHLSSVCGTTTDDVQNKVSNITCSYAMDDDLDLSNSLDQKSMCALSATRALLSAAGGSGSSGLKALLAGNGSSSVGTSSSGSGSDGKNVVIPTGGGGSTNPRANIVAPISGATVAAIVILFFLVWIGLCVGVFFLVKRK